MIEVEDAYQKGYWLYLDMPLSSSLKTLDSFLRKIWLECCGHMSAFSAEDGRGISKATKVGDLPPGCTLLYEYDFGNTTELRISVVSRSRLPSRRGVRLLGRNIPPDFACRVCGAQAEFFCCECDSTRENPFFCEKCLSRHEHEYALPVVNSPRMGVCAYCGEYDTYEFNPSLLENV